MRRTLALTLTTAVAALTLGSLAPTANAVCGGGQPGEPCYCPGIEIKGRPLITC